MRPFYQDDLIKIYHAKYEDVIHDLEADLVLTDPPYGLGNRLYKHEDGFGKKGKARLRQEVPQWDIDPLPDLTPLISRKKVIIWGGNFYPLPPTNSYLVWDKFQMRYKGNQGELAWTNLGCAIQIFRMTRIEAYCSKKRFEKKHICEKPIQLGKWCIELAKGKSVLDPFMGSGCFIIAARMLGIPAIGVDMDKKWCEEAKRRIKIINGNPGFEIRNPE